MVNRENKSGLVIDPQEELSVDEALRGFTVDAAYGYGMKADRGSLEAGKRADLAVLTQDPFSVPTSRLKEVTSALTLVGGRVGWPGSDHVAARKASPPHPVGMSEIGR
jgi:hypothetical protein